jgi:hypothetical protein
VAVVPRVRLLRLWAGGRSNACREAVAVVPARPRRVPDMGCFSGSARVAEWPGWGSPGLCWAGVAWAGWGWSGGRPWLLFHAFDFLPLWAGGRSNACRRRWLVFQPARAVSPIWVVSAEAPASPSGRVGARRASGGGAYPAPTGWGATRSPRRSCEGIWGLWAPQSFDRWLGRAARQSGGGQLQPRLLKLVGHVLEDLQHRLTRR